MINADESYRNGAYKVASLFSTAEGKEVLEFLFTLFGASWFDPSNPRDKALYQQGQSSVIYEIKDMVYKANNGLLDTEDNNGDE